MKKKQIYAKLIKTKKCNVTDMVDLFKTFLSSDEAYLEWVNYPQKNAYVCQISVIVSTKAHDERRLKAVKRGEKIYLVRRDKMNVFLKEIGF